MSESSNSTDLETKKIARVSNKESHHLFTTTHKHLNHLINSMKMIGIDLASIMYHANRSIIKIRAGSPIIPIMPIQALKVHIINHQLHTN